MLPLISFMVFFCVYMTAVLKLKPAQLFVFGGRGSRRCRRPVLTIAGSWGGAAPSEAASERGCHVISAASTKGWSTDGLQGNRGWTRSNTLLLGAAKEPQESQHARSPVNAQSISLPQTQEDSEEESVQFHFHCLRGNVYF